MRLRVQMGNMWTLELFEAHLEEITGKPAAWADRIAPQIHDIIRYTTRAAQGEIVSRTKDAFSLFGYDVMVDENLNVRACCWSCYCVKLQ